MEKLNPWSGEEIKDYGHVFKQFGLNPFLKKLKLDHYLFERDIIIAERGFEKVFLQIKKKKPFINITGIASSGPLHFGHKVDLDLFVFFKKKGGKNYFCASDLDAYLSRSDKTVPSLVAAKKNAVDNLSHALALGLSEKDVYVQSAGSKKNPNRYHEFAFELSKKITKNTFEAVYGHVDLGKVGSNFLQYADIIHPQLKEFEGVMPSVTGIGVDQDPHARITRDIARRLPYGLNLPSFIFFQHQRGLRKDSKMSASYPETAIFLNDNKNVAEKKIKTAFSGGRPTLEEHRRLGGIPEICKVYELLRFHLPSTQKLKTIHDDYKSGKLLSSEIKQIAIDFIIPWLEKHQQKAKQKREIAQKVVFGD